MLQQTRLCRSDDCKKSEVVCTFKYKYQKWKTCKEANVWSAGEHPVEQVAGESRRGIDERVKGNVKWLHNRKWLGNRSVCIHVTFTFSTQKC